MSTPTVIEAADGGLSRFLEQRQWVIDMEEYASRPDIYAGLAPPQWLLDTPNLRLLVPLIHHDRLLGFVLLAQPRGKVQVDWEVSDLLKTAGRQAATHLAQMQAAEALVIARQFDSFNRMSAFVVHDLKNLVAQLSLMLSNAERHKHNPEFQEDMLATVENSVDKMNRLLAQLRSGRSGEANNVKLPVADVVQDALAEKVVLKPKPVVSGRPEGLVVTADRERLVRVLGHVVQNACEATPYDGKVEIRLGRRDGHAVIEVEDTGRGMDEQFIRTRLFRPFDSTKGSGMGIGAHECREYIRELGGRVEVDSAVGRGTQFRIMLPLAADNKSAIPELAQGSGA